MTSDGVPPAEDLAHLDPMMAAFWRGVENEELMIQKCADCGRHQFYPRPFCLACGALSVREAKASGKGWIYSMTTVRALGGAGLTPPYVVAVVELEEGPRLLTNIIDGPCGIGDAVELVWGRRMGSKVPLFRPSRSAR